MSETRQAELSNSSGVVLMFEGVTAVGAVHGRMLEMSLQQRFRNPGELNTEVTYTFPLPFGAVLLGVDVELNGQRLSGLVIAKKAAREQYEEALSDGNTSIMLERNVDFSYTLELGNLLAREACVVTVRYAQVLQFEQSQVRLMLPTTISPRYGNPLTQGGLQPHQVVESDLTVDYPFDVTVELFGDLAKANVACLSHRTSYLPGTDMLTVKLAQKGALDRDFVLVLSGLRQESVAIVSSDKFVDGRSAVMASFSPTLAVGDPRPVAVKILVDCSGSMAGDSIDAAKAALQGVVNRFDRTDKFTLSRFGSEVEHRSRGLWSGSKPAKASGLRWVKGLKADLGGTEMARALVSVVALADEGRADILLITDGEIQGIGEVIDLAKRSGHRVFVVGIGASPAEAHLRRLAIETGGACDFIAPGEDVEPAVVRMFNRLRSPHVSQLKVQWPPEWQVEWKNDIPDLAFEGDTLNLYAVVAGKTSALTGGQISLLGQLEGREEQTVLARTQVSLVEDGANTVARMVAFSKYHEMKGQKSPAGATSAEAVDLAVSYQLITEGTNFILVHERAADNKPSEMPEPHQVRHMLPAGWGGVGSVKFGPSAAMSNAGDVDASISFCMPAEPTDLAIRDAPASYSTMEAPAMWLAGSLGTPKAADVLPGDLEEHEIPVFMRKEAVRVVKPNVKRQRVDRNNPDFWVTHEEREHSAQEVLEWKHGKSEAPKPSGYSGLTPAGLTEWLRINHFAVWPRRFSELQRIGLGLPVCEWLEFVVGEGRRNAETVQAFLLFMYEVDFDGHKVPTSPPLTIITAPPPDLLEQVRTSEVAYLIRQGLDRMDTRKWPDQVVNFAEATDAF